jgi:hypothetical protein
MKEEDFLPPGTSAMEAMEHIMAAVEDNLASREHLTKLIKTMPERVYTPNNNGPRDYFARVDADIRMARKLGHETDLKSVILFAQSAFTQAHKGAAGDIRKVDKEYKAKVKILAPASDAKTTYDVFKKHYVAELREMAVNASFTALDGTANHVAEMQSRKIAELEDQISRLAVHTADLASIYQETQTMQSTIPPSIETARDPAVQAIIDNNKALSAQVATLSNTISNSNYNGTSVANRSTGNTRRNRTTDGECRQFKCYCSSCGVNLSHEGKDCRTKKHWHNDAATFQNQMGGNSKKDHKWMKFLDPTTGKTVDYCVPAAAT